MKAKEYFDDCLHAVRRFNSMCERYAELCDHSIGAVKYDEAHGGSSDPMARIDAAIDYEQIVAERKAELDKTLDYATSILYGNDNRGGLSKLKGSIYADVICMRYLQDTSWKAIAEQSEIYDTKQIRNIAMSGFRAIDRYGFAYLREKEWE